MVSPQTSEAWALLDPPPGTAIHWLAIGTSPSARTSGGTASTSADLDRLIREGREGWGLHLGTQLVRASQRHRPSAGDISQLVTCFIDIDPAGPEAAPLEAAKEITDRVEDLLGERFHPHLIDSGRGAQLWFPVAPTPLLDPLDRLRWRALLGLFLRRLADRLTPRFHCRVDTSCADLPRVGRLPGSLNHKTGRVAHLLEFGVRSETLLTRLQLWGETASHEESRHLSICGVRKPSRWREVLDSLNTTSRRFITEGVSEPGRHSAAYATARRLRELGVSKDVVFPVLCFGASLCDPPLKRSELPRIIDNAWRATDGAQESLRIPG